MDKKILDRNGAGRWEQRLAMFDESTFVLSNLSESRVLDCIPLVDIENVVMVNKQSYLSMLESPVAMTHASLGTAETVTPDDTCEQSPSASNFSMPERVGPPAATNAAPTNRSEPDSESQESSTSDLSRQGSRLRLSAKRIVSNMRREMVGRKFSVTTGSLSGLLNRSGQEEHDYEEGMRSFNIITRAHGYNGGRTFSLRVSTETECREWVDTLLPAVRRAQRLAERTAMGSGLARMRALAKQTYQTAFSQTFFALIIIASFGASIVEAELQPAPASEAGLVFSGLELTFAIIFSLELAFNMFGSWMWAFVRSAWNWFDAIVVIVSVISVASDDLPGVDLIRFIRVFRVVKLFRFNKSLRHLINAITAAIFPVLNSLIIFFLFTCIYAVLATNIFGRRANDGADQGNNTQQILLEEHFGTFSSSFFTMACKPLPSNTMLPALSSLPVRGTPHVQY